MTTRAWKERTTRMRKKKKRMTTGPIARVVSLKVLMPPKEAVYEYEAFIQDLKLDFPSPFLDGRTTWATRSLQRLRLDALKHKESPAALEVLDQLLTNSPSLNHVELMGFKVSGKRLVIL